MTLVSLPESLSSIQNSWSLIDWSVQCAHSQLTAFCIFSTSNKADDNGRVGCGLELLLHTCLFVVGREHNWLGNAGGVAKGFVLSNLLWPSILHFFSVSLAQNISSLVQFNASQLNYSCDILLSRLLSWGIDPSDTPAWQHCFRMDS